MKMRLLLMVTIFVLQVMLTIVYFYFDRHGNISISLRSWGVWGILISLVLMAGFSVFPIPSEFLLLVNMKVYGVIPGVIDAWVGTMMGTVVIFLVARHIGSPLIYHLVPEKHLNIVETWVRKNGVLGLLLARLLPIPAPFLNYAAGVLKSVNFWNYFWTMAVSIWPYYIGAACLFVGVPNKAVYSILFGILLLVALWIFGVKLNRKFENE